jgi:hypothetical protein
MLVAVSAQVSKVLSFRFVQFRHSRGFTTTVHS